MNLLSPENLDKARALAHPIPQPVGLALPSVESLEDARWQQAHAGEKAMEFVNAMRVSLETPAAATPMARARRDRNLAFVRALEFFFASNANLLTLLDEREELMRESMAEAQFTYRQMRLDRDFYRHEAQAATGRLHHENDLATLLATRFGTSDAA